MIYKLNVITLPRRLMAETIHAQGNAAGDRPTTPAGQETADELYLRHMRALKSGYSSGHAMRAINEAAHQSSLGQRICTDTSTPKQP